MAINLVGAPHKESELMARSQSKANANRLLSVGEVAAMFGVAESQVRERMTKMGGHIWTQPELQEISG